MKNPIQVMVWSALTEKGATKPYFIEEGETIDSKYYTRRILPQEVRIFVHFQFGLYFRLL